MPSRKRSKTEAAEALAAVGPLVTRWVERLLGQAEPPLTVAQYMAMRAIAREELSGGELARRTGVSGPATSQLLSTLVGRGLIERSAAIGDRRRRALALTTAGESALEAAGATLKKEIAPLLGDVPGPEVDSLARLLPRIEAIFSGVPPPRPQKPHPPPPPRKP